MSAATNQEKRVWHAAIVEDDRDIALSLMHNLQKGGEVSVAHFTSGEELLAKLLSFRPDCVVLDLGLPGMDGFAVCRELRNHPIFGSVPILILTARVEEAEKLLGFELGADDYVTKPYSVREVGARVRALLRRADGKVATGKGPVYDIGPVRVDCTEQRVSRDGEEIRLTRKEFDLLRYLIEARGAVISRDTLLQEVWGYDFPGETRTVDVHVTRLRKKLGTNAIETVIGSGYRLSRPATGGGRKA